MEALAPREKKVTVGVHLSSSRLQTFGLPREYQYLSHPTVLSPFGGLSMEEQPIVQKCGEN